MDLRYTQGELLEHKNYKSTAGKIKTPLDDLNSKKERNVQRNLLGNEKWVDFQPELVYPN